MGVLADPLGWFTLEMPEGWVSRTEDCITTLTGPLGVGVGYLGGGRHVGGRQPSFGGADFLMRFLAHLGIAVPEGAIESMGGVECRIYYYCREGGGVRWRHWSVTDDETALLISYVCDVGDAQLEAADMDAIVRSVRLYHSAPVH